MPSQALTVHCRAATTASKSPTSRVVARRQSSQNQRFTWFSAPRLVAFTPNLGAGSRVLTKPAECPRILIRVQPPDPARELHGRGVSLHQTDDCASFRIIDDRSGFRLGAGFTASRCPTRISDDIPPYAHMHMAGHRSMRHIRTRPGVPCCKIPVRGSSARRG